AHAETVGKTVDQSGEIGAVVARRLAIETELRRRKFFDALGRQHQILDAEAGIDLLDLLLEQTPEMARVARREGRPDRNALDAAIDAIGREAETARAEPLLAEAPRQMLQQFAQRCGDRFRRQNRLGA